MGRSRALLLAATLLTGYAAAGGPAAPSLAAGSATSTGGSFYAALGGQERTLARTTLQDALESLASRRIGRWRDQATGASGTVEPLRTFRISTGHYCREFRERMQKDGRRESRTSTACRNDQGRWIVVGPHGT